MVARALWRSEALRVVPWLRPCTRLRLVQGLQGTTLRASDHHNARATFLNPFNKLQWNSYQNTFLTYENAFENVACEMAVISFRGDG